MDSESYHYLEVGLERWYPDFSKPHLECPGGPRCRACLHDAEDSQYEKLHQVYEDDDYNIDRLGLLSTIEVGNRSLSDPRNMYPIPASTPSPSVTVDKLSQCLDLPPRPPHSPYAPPINETQQSLNNTEPFSLSSMARNALAAVVNSASPHQKHPSWTPLGTISPALRPLPIKSPPTSPVLRPLHIVSPLPSPASSPHMMTPYSYPQSRPCSPGLSSTGAVVGYNPHPILASEYVCKHPGCTAAPFQTQYLLNSHSNVHSSARPHFCPFPGCPRAEGGKGFKRKNEMIRHGLVHESPGYICPFCPDREHKYPRPDNLERHVRVHHVNRDKDDPILRAVLAQRPDGPNRGRRRRGIDANNPSTAKKPVDAKDIPGFDGKPSHTVTASPALGDQILLTYLDRPLSDKQRSSSPQAVTAANGSSSQARRLFGLLEATGGSMNPTDHTACDPVEGAFTDSGYASAPPKSKEQRPADDSDATEDDADSRTVISAATTIVPTIAQHSISEICYDIYSNIHGRVDAQNKDSLFEAFTDAIKIFAIRFAHLDSSQINRQIMHFVYTRHREIAAELRQMFNLEHEEEEEVDETSKPKDGMSFTEKIVAWLDRPERQSPEPVDASEKFEGVEDDLDLSSNHAELPLYSQKIFQSKAYKFLIEDLLKESTLQWEGSQLWAADAIRHRIIGGLPPTKISKSRDPCIHDIEFQIPQQGIKRRLQHEMERRTVGIREAMLTAVVLVSSSDDVIQATTVEEYVKQTWGLRDMRLFDIIGGLLAEELSPSNYDSDGLVSISAALTSMDTISVKAKGVSHSVADCGTQMAWMLAALQGSDCLPGEVACTGPSIFRASPQDPWEITAIVEQHAVNNIPYLSPLKKLGWLDTEIEQVIAHGFPTTRRPAFPRGVEISPTVLFSLISESSLEGTNTHARLSGASGRLELVHQKDNICLWHALTSQELCICPKDTSFQISTKNIRQFRHILGDCLHSAGSKCKLNTASPPSTTSLCRKNGSSGYGSRASTPRSPSNSPNSTTICPETSLDSDMMSIPDSLEASNSRIPDEISPIIDAVAHQLLREYRNAFVQKEVVSEDNFCGQQFHGAALGLESSTVRTRPGSSARNLAPADAPALHSAGTSGLTECLKPSRKRGRGLGDDDENDDGDGKMPPPKKPRRGQDLPHHKTLACPFWKLDPRRHRRCLKLDSFWLVNRVKQHLTRSHTEPKIFCDKCKTTFPDEGAKERHLRQDGHLCSFKPWNEHLITRSQQVELHKKSRPDTSEAERWFDIWGILFPGRPRPSSPYIDTGVSDDLREFREYTRIRGREVLFERLQAAGFSYRYPDSSLSDEDLEVYRLEAADRALDAMIEDFLSSRSSPGSAQQQGRAVSSDASGQETPVSSFTDSGIGSSTQHNLPPILEDDLSTAQNLDLSEFNFDELGIPDVDLTVGNHLQAPDLDGNFTSSESGPPWNTEFDPTALDWTMPPLGGSDCTWALPQSSPPPDLDQIQG